jgi:hypothetical protein
MGAGFSTSNALHIQFPKIDYFPGEILEGVVALNCIKPITTNGIHIEVKHPSRTCQLFSLCSVIAQPPFCHACTIKLPIHRFAPLQVLGSENTSFYTNEHDSTTGSTGSRHQYGYFDFLKVTLPLGPPGTLQPGQYQVSRKSTTMYMLAR